MRSLRDVGFIWSTFAFHSAAAVHWATGLAAAVGMLVTLVRMMVSEIAQVVVGRLMMKDGILDRVMVPFVGSLRPLAATRMAAAPSIGPAAAVSAPATPMVRIVVSGSGLVRLR